MMNKLKQWWSNLPTGVKGIIIVMILGIGAISFIAIQSV